MTHIIHAYMISTNKFNLYNPHNTQERKHNVSSFHLVSLLQLLGHSLYLSELFVSVSLALEEYQYVYQKFLSCAYVIPLIYVHTGTTNATHGKGKHNVVSASSHFVGKERSFGGFRDGEVYS
jgi:hypothetical protein